MAKIIHPCTKCRNNTAVKLRRLDKSKLPQQYYHKPDADLSIIMKLNKMDTSNTDYWIHLPPSMILSKYDYYLCADCYKDNCELNYEWNYWTNLV
jgi:hypothetical protein